MQNYFPVCDKKKTQWLKTLEQLTDDKKFLLHDYVTVYNCWCDIPFSIHFYAKTREMHFCNRGCELRRRLEFSSAPYWQNKRGSCQQVYTTTYKIVEGKDCKRIRLYICFRFSTGLDLNYYHRVAKETNKKSTVLQQLTFNSYDATLQFLFSSLKYRKRKYCLIENLQQQLKTYMDEACTLKLKSWGKTTGHIRMGKPVK